MRYQDTGYDNNLNKSIFSSRKERLTEIEAEENIEGFPFKDLVPRGSLIFKDGRTEINAEEGYIETTDGVVPRFRLGKQKDGTYGVRLWDKDGNILIDNTGNNNTINT